MSEAGDVTILLDRIGGGDELAVRDLYRVVYDRLRERAQSHLSGERKDHTLQATALVHEAFLKLSGRNATRWRNSQHFYNAVSEAMRQILLDHARRYRSLKRGGNRKRVPLDEYGGPQHDLGPDGIDAEALERALVQLGKEDPRRHQVVMYRYFAGLPERQIGAILSISEKTVRRDWQASKLFLLKEMAGDLPTAP